jgi:hypothetical protein
VQWAPEPEPEPEPPGDLSIDELLSEDLPIPEGAAAEQAFSYRDLLDEDLSIPPSPPSEVYRDLFAPDPDDPLVQATQAPADDERGRHGKGRRRRG